MQSGHIPWREEEDGDEVLSLGQRKGGRSLDNATDSIGMVDKQKQRDACEQQPKGHNYLLTSRVKSNDYFPSIDDPTVCVLKTVLQYHSDKYSVRDTACAPAAVASDQNVDEDFREERGKRWTEYYYYYCLFFFFTDLIPLSFALQFLSTMVTLITVWCIFRWFAANFCRPDHHPGSSRLWSCLQNPQLNDDSFHMDDRFEIAKRWMPDERLNLFRVETFFFFFLYKSSCPVLRR